MAEGSVQLMKNELGKQYWCVVLDGKTYPFFDDVYGMEAAGRALERIQRGEDNVLGHVTGLVPVDGEPLRITEVPQTPTNDEDYYDLLACWKACDPERKKIVLRVVKALALA